MGLKSIVYWIFGKVLELLSTFISDREIEVCKLSEHAKIPTRGNENLIMKLF